MHEFRAGIDIGSTTVKLAVLNENDEIIYGEYRCHHAQTRHITLPRLMEPESMILQRKLHLPTCESLSDALQVLVSALCKRLSRLLR